VVEIVDELPKTATGKIMRRMLKTAPDAVPAAEAESRVA
jgi:acyl-coenzyme A synthetase/AMP-(fatty) acid ligase